MIERLNGLTKRRQYVQIEDVKSSKRKNLFFGHLTFALALPELSIYNDLMLHTNLFETLLFTDDPNPSIKDENLNQISNQINERQQKVL